MNIETRIKRIADKNNLSYKTVIDQVLKGAIIEHNEHPWGSVSQAIKIALDHVEQNSNHYKKELMKYSLNGLGALSESDFIQDKNEAGKYIYPKSGNVNVREAPGTAAKIITTVAPGKKIGFILGRSTKAENGYFWYAIQLDPAVGFYNYGFVAVEVVSLSNETMQPTTTDNSETLVMLIKAVTESDVVIYKRLVVMTAQIALLKQRGIPTSEMDKVYQTLVSRYVSRQNRIKQVLGAYGYMLSTPQYEIYQWIRKNFGIGAVQIPAAIVVGVIVAVSATATYAIIKALEPEYNSQEVDLEVTGEFKKWFDTIPDENAKKAIASELEAQIDDAYNQGVKDSGSGGFFDSLKYLLIAGVAVWGFTRLMDSQDRRRYATNPRRIM